MGRPRGRAHVALDERPLDAVADEVRRNRAAARSGAREVARLVGGGGSITSTEYLSLVDRVSALSGSLTTNSGVLLMNALLAGQGIVVGPDLMFEAHLAHKRLRLILEDFPFEKTALYAVFPPARFTSVNRRAFVEFLAAALVRRRAVN